jgi:hypothetical protein
VPENAGKTKWVPAISVGGIARTNDSNVGDGSNGQTKTNGDIYAVATKVITQISKKVPVLINAGVRGTNSSLWGLGGNAPDFSARAFGALAFVFTGPGKSTIILASEVRSSRRRSSSTASGSTAAPSTFPPRSTTPCASFPRPSTSSTSTSASCRRRAESLPTGDLKARARFAFGISYGFMAVTICWVIRCFECACVGHGEEPPPFLSG